MSKDLYLEFKKKETSEWLLEFKKFQIMKILILSDSKIAADAR